MRGLGVLRQFLFLLLCAMAAIAQATTEGAKEPQKFLRIRLEGEPWAVQVNVPGFVIEIEMPYAEVDTLQAHNPDTGIVLSLRLERRRNGPIGTEGCRDWLVSERNRISSTEKQIFGVPVKVSKLSSREINGVPVFEYSLNVGGLTRQSFLASMAKDDACIQLHLSKDKFKPAQEQLFTSILEATQIVAAEPAASPARATDANPASNAASQQAETPKPEKAVPIPEAESAKPQPGSTAPDLYDSSFSGYTYSNHSFGFSITFPDGWLTADTTYLRQKDDQQRTHDLEELAKQTGRSDLFQSGSVDIARVYTLMVARSKPSSNSDEDFSLIFVKAHQRGLPSLLTGACADFYFQENDWFLSKNVKSIAKLEHAAYGGSDFSQQDFRFKEAGREHFVRVMATCESQLNKYYLVFEFVGNSRDTVKHLSEAAGSIHFAAPSKDAK